MADFLRLILLILLLPLIIVVIGPLLVLAAVRGQQQMGPITLDSTRYNSAGRAGIFLLGLAVWLLVWSGLAYLAVQALTPVPGAVAVQMTPTPHPPTATPTPVPPTATTIPPTATPRPTQTATPVITSPTAPAASATASATITTPAAESATHTPTAAPSPTLPAASATPPPTASPVVAPTTTVTGTQILIASRVSLADQQAALNTVREANSLLRLAITRASPENLANLQRLWQGQALTDTKSYAIEVNSRYKEPFDVELDYATPLTVSEQSVPRQIVVFSNEKWTYGGPSRQDQENFEFIYTVTPKDDGWVISRYTYRNWPGAQPSPTPAN